MTGTIVKAPPAKGAIDTETLERLFKEIREYEVERSVQRHCEND